MTDTELEEIGYDKIFNHLERGDYQDPAELKVVKKWLEVKDKERKHLADCQRADTSFALDASRSASIARIIAIVALVISFLSLVISFLGAEQIKALLGF
jgi:hypothetical protein